MFRWQVFLLVCAKQRAVAENKALHYVSTAKKQQIIFDFQGFALLKSDGDLFSPVKGLLPWLYHVNHMIDTVNPRGYEWMLQ